jgi:aryl-alcohol dehydrogenase-like predicted oxidoreductase
MCNQSRASSKLVELDGSSAVGEERSFGSGGLGPSRFNREERLLPKSLRRSETAATELIMETRQFGTTDMRVSVLGFGAAEIGFEEAEQQTVDRVLREALDLGLNVIDTGECYRNSEEMIGRAVSDRRDHYYLFTKCGHPHGIESGANWTHDSLLESIQRSLQRLHTDHLDIVHLHSCGEDVLQKGEAIAALQTARERGYTRYIGYSGDGHAAKYAAACGAFDSLQISISIADQEALEMALPLARERGMGVIAKRPLANVAWKTSHKPTSGYHHEYWERLRKLNYPFLQTSNLNKAVSVALRFTLDVPGVHLAIVGTTKPERSKQNAALLEAGPLKPEQFQEIRDRWCDVAPQTWVGQT